MTGNWSSTRILCARPLPDRHSERRPVLLSVRQTGDEHGSSCDRPKVDAQETVDPAEWVSTPHNTIVVANHSCNHRRFFQIVPKTGTTVSVVSWPRTDGQNRKSIWLNNCWTRTAVSCDLCYYSLCKSAPNFNTNSYYTFDCSQNNCFKWVCVC